MIRRIETITDADLETIASVWLRSNLSLMLLLTGLLAQKLSNG